MYVISKWLLLLLLINEKLLEIKDNWLAEVRMLVVFFLLMYVYVCVSTFKEEEEEEVEEVW